MLSLLSLIYSYKSLCYYYYLISYYTRAKVQLRAYYIAISSISTTSTTRFIFIIIRVIVKRQLEELATTIITATSIQNAFQLRSTIAAQLMQSQILSIGIIQMLYIAYSKLIAPIIIRVVVILFLYILAIAISLDLLVTLLIDLFGPLILLLYCISYAQQLYSRNYIYAFLQAQFCKYLLLNIFQIFQFTIFVL